MLDLSLNIMDIIENSVSAKATEISILIEMSVLSNRLHINIKDNGKGMDKDLIEMVQNPFYTSKNHRIKKIGLGIPLFKQGVEMCNGSFEMNSEEGSGTEIDVNYQNDHIDRMPLGNLADTFSSAIIGHPEVDFVLELEKTDSDENKEAFHLSTIEVKNELGDVPITYPEVVKFIRQHIKKEIKKIELEEI